MDQIWIPMTLGLFPFVLGDRVRMYVDARFDDGFISDVSEPIAILDPVGDGLQNDREIDVAIGAVFATDPTSEQHDPDKAVAVRCACITAEHPDSRRRCSIELRS